MPGGDVLRHHSAVRAQFLLGSLGTWRKPQDLAITIVDNQPYRAVRSLAHIADAVAASIEQLLLRDHLTALDHQP